MLRASSGDTGAGYARPMGERGGDAWTKREHASEEMWIRREEKARLEVLKEKLADRKAHLKEVGQLIDEVAKGGDTESAKKSMETTGAKANPYPAFDNMKAAHRDAVEAHEVVEKHM
jgi:ATPase inhibitor, mitochondrial